MKSARILAVCMLVQLVCLPALFGQIREIPRPPSGNIGPRTGPNVPGQLPPNTVPPNNGGGITPAPGPGNGVGSPPVGGGDPPGDDFRAPPVSVEEDWEEKLKQVEAMIKLWDSTAAVREYSNKGNTLWETSYATAHDVTF